MKFIDRFKRKTGSLISDSILYQEKLLKNGHNRDNLPSRFRIDGVLIWKNTNDEYHNVNGPARSNINGDLQYWVNDLLVTKFEAML